jgi:hypothetical protein
MTETAKKLVKEFERELEKLPEEEQEEYAASFLEDLRHRKQKEEKAEEDPYSALKILRDARLSGPEDASVTYEKELYGPHSGSDQ